MGLFDIFNRNNMNIENDTPRQKPIEDITPQQELVQKFRYCTHCGAKIFPTAKFCAECGTPVSTLETSVETKETPVQNDASIQSKAQSQTQSIPTPKKEQVQSAQNSIPRVQQAVRNPHAPSQNQSQNQKNTVSQSQTSTSPETPRVISKNTRIVYAEKKNIKRDGKIGFKDLNKNTYYVDEKMVDAFETTITKQKGWVWIEATGDEAILLKKKTKIQAKISLEKETLIFEKNYKVGDEFFGPILTDNNEDYRLVSLGTTFYTNFQMKDVPDHLKQDMFQKGDIYRFKITDIGHTENNGLRVGIIPVGRGCIVNEKPKAEIKSSDVKTMPAELENAAQAEVSAKTPASYVSDYIYSNPNGRSELIQAEKKETLTAMDAKSEVKVNPVTVKEEKKEIVKPKTSVQAVVSEEKKQEKVEIAAPQKLVQKPVDKKTEENVEAIKNNATTNSQEDLSNKENKSSQIERMILVKYLGITGDKADVKANFKFISMNGRYYYIYVSRAKEYVNAEKTGEYYWLKQDGKKFHIITNKTDKESHSKAFGYEINLFTKNYKEGDIEVFQIGDIKEDHMQVFYSANCSGRVYENDLPDGKTLADYNSGDLYRFKISFKTTPNRKDPTKEDTIVNLTPVERFDADAIKPKRSITIPDNLIEECDMRSLTALRKEIDDDILWENLEAKIGEKVTEKSFREYLNTQFQKQKENNTLDVKYKANGIAIDIDLDIKNGHGVPQKVGVNSNSGKEAGFYLSLLGAVDPGQWFDKKVYTEEWIGVLNKLAEMALPEDWGNRNSILKSYLKHTFYKVWIDGELVEEGDDAVFNTGLVDNSYDDIYCYLTKCNNPKNIYNRKWEIGFFACWGKGQDGKKLNRIFSRTPSLAKYIKDGQFQNLYLDVSKFGTAEKLSVDYEHIIMDNIKRLPTELIQKELASQKELMEMIDRGEPATKWRDYIINNDDMVRTLKDVLESAVKLAIKNCKWNYKTAIPIYYARSNNISLLLPLKLIDKHNLNPRSLPDVALVIERYPNGSYQGQTILTMDMAYKDARLICRPNSEWLAIPSEESDENEDEEE